MKKLLLTMMIITICSPVVVLAHPGRVDSSGCHTCKTNCESYGLSTGQYHCHNGSDRTNWYLPSSNPTPSNPTPSPSTNSQPSNNVTTNNNTNTVTQPVIKKSSDNTIKSITINNDTVAVKDYMEYKTPLQSVEIIVETSHSAAKYIIDGNQQLEGKTNEFTITVTAENGEQKSYNLTITKVSNNTNIKVVVNNEEIQFDNYLTSIDVNYDVRKLDYKYETEDENATVTVIGGTLLLTGENTVTFKVTAEDGTKQEYTLTVNRLTASESREKDEKESDIGDAILGVLVLTGTGVGVALATNKKKK